MREIFVLSNCVLFLKHRQMFPEQFDQMRYLCQYLRMFEKYNVNRALNIHNLFPFVCFGDLFF